VIGPDRRRAVSIHSNELSVLHERLCDHMRRGLLALGVRSLEFGHAIDGKK
jgi:hypothetical protein